MEDLAKTIQQKYIDDITSKYPLYRFLILWIYLISIYSYISKGSSMRIVEEMNKIKINYLFDFSDGLLSELSIGHLFLSIFSTFISAFLYSKFKEKTFSLLSKIKDFKKYTEEIAIKHSNNKSQDGNVNFFISKDISVELKSHREKIKSLHSTGEILLALIICLSYGANFFVIKDYLLVALFFSLIIYIQWSSFNYYISKFIPYYVAERVLLGVDVKFGDD